MNILKKIKKHREHKREARRMNERFKRRNFYRLINFIKDDNVDLEQHKDSLGYLFRIEDENVYISKKLRYLKFGLDQFFLKGSDRTMLKIEIQDSIARFAGKNKKEI